jgi:NAD(P)-dependent dehydrogenase (short-subunit alcohol dehydrogenase family)
VGALDRAPGRGYSPDREETTMLDLGLTGKVAIVTGGSEGLGRATAMRLAAEGAHVVICARRKDVLERAAEDVRRQTGVQVLALPADVTRSADVDAVVSAALGTFGGVDILVNNAGTSSAASFEKVDDATWEADIQVKLMAAIRFCRLVIPQMKTRGGGRIINVTTVGGKAPAARALPTSVTRAAGINLTKSLANEYAPDRILVNTICLGLVKSAQWERRAKGGDLEGYYREAAKRVPVGRMGEAEEFADLVAFLVSERAAYITGTAINFDGGMSAAF